MRSLLYGLRERVQWTGRAHRERAGDSLPATDRGRELLTRYPALEALRPRLSRATLDEALGALDLLDRLPRAPLLSSLNNATVLRALDVGAKNWRYLPGLSAWLRALAADAGPARIEGQGVEVDAYRLYSDLTTRASCGRFFAELCSDAAGVPTGAASSARFEYRAADVRASSEPAALVTWFLPFVTPGPHRAWGLPRRLFDPEGVARHVEERVAPGGALVMANQGEWEREAAQPAFTRLKLAHEARIEGSLHASPYPIFLTVWTREA